MTFGHQVAPERAHALPGQCLAIATYREGRARPDGVLAADEHFEKLKEYAD